MKRLFAVVALLARALTAQSHASLLPSQPAQPPEAETPLEKCQVEEREKIPCGPPDVSARRCERMGCCFSGQRCYYGKAVTVQCTRDGQFVVVVAREATLPKMDVRSIRLLESRDPSCGPVRHSSAFVIFQFPVTACGTTMEEEDGQVVYKNLVSSLYEVGVGPRGSVTRDSHFEFSLQCRYSDTAVEALVLAVEDVPPPGPVAATGPLRVELRLGNGQCHGKACTGAGEAAYTSYYTPAEYPVTKVLREPVYVEVRLLERTDPSIILNLERCWATSSPNPLSQPQWDLLIDGCPYNEDRHQTAVVPVDDSSDLLYPTHYKRFIIKMFAFVDPDTFSRQNDTVFLHCTTAVCYPTSTSSCEQPCYRRRRAEAAVSKVSSNQRALVSSSEVILMEQETKFAPNATSETRRSAGSYIWP